MIAIPFQDFQQHSPQRLALVPANPNRPTPLLLPHPLCAALLKALARPRSLACAACSVTKAGSWQKSQQGKAGRIGKEAPLDRDLGPGPGPGVEADLVVAVAVAVVVTVTGAEASVCAVECDVPSVELLEAAVGSGLRDAILVG